MNWVLSVRLSMRNAQRSPLKGNRFKRKSPKLVSPEYSIKIYSDCCKYGGSALACPATTLHPS